MLDIEELRQMNQLSHLTDHMLEKIKKVTTIKKYSAGDYIFHEGEYADYLYAIIDGNVVLEVDKDSDTRVLIDEFGKCRTLGLSSLLDSEQKKHISHVRALRDTTVFAWKCADMEKLFYEDYELGFLFMKRAACILKKRLELKNAQLAAFYN